MIQNREERGEKTEERTGKRSTGIEIREKREKREYIRDEREKRYEREERGEK